MRIINYFIIFGLLVLLSNCGFKVVNESDFMNFKITNLTSSGEQRINYKLKNLLLTGSQDNNENLITLDLKTQKKKEVKEKNIKNEITKYNVIIIVKVEIKILDNLKVDNFVVKKDGEYNVSTNHSQSLSNEKKLINNLVVDLGEIILNKISLKINDI